MRLNSALEDLTSTTLRAVAGMLGRLQYLSSLRSAGGRYLHWGLERLYGEQAAQEALTHAHHSVLAKILATPLRELLDDLEECSTQAGLTPRNYLKNLRNCSLDLLPENPGSGSEQHFNSVLYALSNLQQGRRAAIPPIS
jgi:hypothetical protein